MLRTRITDLLGIKYPVVQGAMMWIARAGLVSAVSNAGGLGILTSLTFPNARELAAEIKKVRTLTGNPFAVNVTLLPTLTPVNYDEYIDAIVSEGVKIVETAGRSPEPFIGKFKSAGMKVIHKCTAVRFAQKAESIGCDAVIIDGFECGGIPGEDDVTSLILTPLTSASLKIPVIAAGGYGDGRGLVAALALGAEGIYMGTRFMMTREAPVHNSIKERLINMNERDTLLLLRAFRNTERVMKSPLAERAAEMEKSGATIEELAPLIAGQRGREALEKGDIDHGVISVGQVIGLIHDIPAVDEMIQRIVKEAEDIISTRLNGLVKR